MIIEGIEFNMDWSPGTSPRAMLPRGYGIYCEVLWPVRGIRIGISKNLWARHGGHASWMRSMKRGTGARKGRSGPLANHAKDWGDLGLETFVLSTHPSLQSEEVRLRCESALHAWAEEQTIWKNFNGEKWRPKNYGLPVIDEEAAAQSWGVDLCWSRS